MFPASNTSTGFLNGLRVSHLITRQTENAQNKNVKNSLGRRMSHPLRYSPPMTKEELAIACVLYVAEQEQITPQEILWGIVPIANRQIVCDGSPYEKEPEQAA